MTGLVKRSSIRQLDKSDPANGCQSLTWLQPRIVDLYHETRFLQIGTDIASVKIAAVKIPLGKFPGSVRIPSRDQPVQFSCSGKGVL